MLNKKKKLINIVYLIVNEEIFCSGTGLNLMPVEFSMSVVSLVFFELSWSEEKPPFRSLGIVYALDFAVFI
jgi:hypothetical protein